LEEIKNILEMSYYISGLGLFFVAYKALKQIEIAKEQIQQTKEVSSLNSKRDAMKVTSSQVKNYLEVIIPAQNKLDKKIDENKIQFFKKSKIKIEGNKLKLEPFIIQTDNEKMPNIFGEYTHTMNLMEAFSLYMISGVADEKLAFRSISSTFCTSAEKLLPLYLVNNIQQKEKYYKSIIDLYIIWSTRLKKEMLEMEQKELTKELKSCKNIEIDIIGT
jgi:hypothetical protein